MLLPLTPVRLKRHAAQVFGRKVGVVCGEDRFTYREFNERADRLSAALLRLGVRKGDRVAYLSCNCHRMVEAFYGVPQIGAILLPMDGDVPLFFRLEKGQVGGFLNRQTEEWQAGGRVI